LWGPHTVDRFASNLNKKLIRYNSLFWNPNSEAVDTFTQNWRGEHNLIIPPVSLVIRAIKHIIYCKKKAKKQKQKQNKAKQKEKNPNKQNIKKKQQRTQMNCKKARESS
jgi:hypothetical protein